MNDLAKIIDNAKERLSLCTLPLYNDYNAEEDCLNIIGYVKEVDLDKLCIECVVPEYMDMTNKFITLNTLGNIVNGRVIFDSLDGFTLVDIYNCNYSILDNISFKKDYVGISMPLAVRLSEKSIYDIRVYPIEFSKLYFSDESIIKYNKYIDSINKEINVYIGTHEDILEAIKNHTDSKLIIGKVKNINISSPTAEMDIKSNLYTDILSKNIYYVKPIFKYILPYIDKNGNFTNIIGDFYISHFELVCDTFDNHVLDIEGDYMYYSEKEIAEMSCDHNEEKAEDVDDDHMHYEIDDYPILEDYNTSDENVSKSKNNEYVKPEDNNTFDECEVDTNNKSVEVQLNDTEDHVIEKEEAQVKLSDYPSASYKIRSGIERLKEYELRRNLQSGGEL
jgi:hypothetical protein